MQSNQKFETYEDWANHSAEWLSGHPTYRPDQAICYDMTGQLCRVGVEFVRAQRENAFPVCWLWPDQMSEAAGAWRQANNMDVPA